MQFSIVIDQSKAMEWHLSCAEAALFSFLYNLPSWAEHKDIEGDLYYYVAKSKIIAEMPMLTDKADTVYRLLKSLGDKGIIAIVRINNRMYIALTEKGKQWNRVQSGNKSEGSEINPDRPSEGRKNFREGSEKNPNNLGNFSDISVNQLSGNQLSDQSSSDDDSSADADLIGDEPTPLAASRSSKTPPAPEQAIVDLYHDMLPQLPRVAKLTDKRRRWLRARWHDDPGYQSLDFWRTYFEIVQQSPHLLGENDRGWIANFEWLINSSNFVKTLERQYVAKEGPNGSRNSGHHSERPKSATEGFWEHFGSEAIGHG